MKLAYIEQADGAQFAVSTSGHEWALLRDLGLHPHDTADAVAATATLDATSIESRATQTNVTFRCPVVRPSKIIGVGYNYAAHARETGAAPTAFPVLFGKFPNALNGPYDDIVIDSSLTSMVDYEAELAIILGADAASAVADPAAAIYGYAVANDVSARDCQIRDVQVARGKGFDTFCPLGPWIVASDAVPAVRSLRVRSFVNGDKRQDAPTADMEFDVETLVAYIGSGTTLEPGDVILTGSPSGAGHGMTPPRYLGDRDIVRCEIDEIGWIENRVTVKLERQAQSTMATPEVRHG